VDPKILELIDRINATQRSVLAIADLLSCSDGHSLLEDTLPDIGTILVRTIQEAIATSAEIYNLLRTIAEETSE
jgi:hypothetical protein